MEENKKDFSFEEKIQAEVEKRNSYIAEADSIIESIEQHCKDKKKKIENIDMERNSVINKIHDVVNQKDMSQLDNLFERLR